MVSLVCLVIVVHLEPMRLLVSKVTLVSLAQAVPLVCLDVMDLLVDQDWTAYREFLDRKETLDPKVNLVIPVKKVIAATTAYQDCPANLE